MTYTDVKCSVCGDTFQFPGTPDTTKEHHSWCLECYLQKLEERGIEAPVKTSNKLFPGLWGGI